MRLFLIDTDRDAIHARNAELLPSDIDDTYEQIRLDQMRNSLADFARDERNAAAAAWIETLDDAATTALCWLLDQPALPILDETEVAS